MAVYEKPPKYIAYGTAGFRDKAAVLDTILYRVGLVAAMRSRYLKGETVGVMITASHNPPADNGAKIVDPYGDMLEQSWEPKVTKIANAQSSTECTKLVNEMYAELSIDKSLPAVVQYARDTRESGRRLADALSDGLAAADARIGDLGILTTPQLHYTVRAVNTLGGPENNSRHLESYGVPSEVGYYKKMATALRAAMTSSRTHEPPLAITLDCANGVGAIKMKEMASYVQEYVDVTVVNDECFKPELLNMDCGADYVKTNQRLPRGVEPKPNALCASFDGDADRVVFYYVDDEEVFHLLDGDKIATLIAAFLKTVIQHAGSKIESAGNKIDIGVVQTAYANGSSTEYITSKLGLPVACTPTGVKHLHHAAQEFDIGVYFEANGHGTVLFADEPVQQLRQTAVHNEAERRSIDTLLALSDLINQTVGDAISDLLAVVAILVIDRLTPKDWDRQYQDLPNRLLKADVKDRTLFVTTDAERRLVSPDGLQDQINELVSKVIKGRSFVRASGTEDVVRIYAEAESRVAADTLAEDVKQLIVKNYGR